MKKSEVAKDLRADTATGPSYPVTSRRGENPGWKSRRSRRTSAPTRPRGQAGQTEQEGPDPLASLFLL